MRVLLEIPSNFSFRRTVASHGWCDLAPFTATPDARSLSTVVAMTGGGARRVTVREDGKAVVVETPGAVVPTTRRAVVVAARRMLGLDVDVSEFHDAVRRDLRYRWIAETGTGRLLRGPTAWEDVVKLVLTTNCSWAFTKKMTTALVARYGETAPDGARSFPSPERLAEVKEKEFRNDVRAGYRSPYLVALSRDVASGACDPGAWDDDPREAELLRK
jgi:N-glycosylase/DNA lyase